MGVYADLRRFYWDVRRRILPPPPLCLPDVPLLPPADLAPLWPRVTTIDADVIDTQHRGQDLFVRVARNEDRPSPPPLLTADPAIARDDEAGHHARVRGPGGEVGCFMLHDAIYDPGLFSALDETGAALFAPELIYPAWADEIRRGQLRATPRREFDRDIDAVCVACLSSQYHSYGAFLLDTLPRLWLARRMLGPAWSKARILLDRDMPPWLWPILSRMGVTREQCLPLVRVLGRRRIRLLLLPTPMHTDYRFHTMANLVWDSLPDSTWPSAPRRIYIPRPQNDTLRRFDNQAEVMEVAARAGFEVVEPWKQPWPRQLSLFRQAEIIVGPYGSALHNAVVSPPGTRIVCFPFVNHIQSGIAGLRDHRLAYVSATAREGGEGAAAGFSVDPQAVRRALEAALDGVPHGHSLIRDGVSP